MAAILAWCVLPVVCTLMGFYLGTFLASQHIQDIQGRDVDKGVIGALIGFALSILIGLVVPPLYARRIEKEYVARELHSAHH